MLFLRKKIIILEKKIDNIANKLEKSNLYEYGEVLANTKKLLWRNFVLGISKGIGIALGFSIFGAIAIYLLRKIVMLNIPVIGAFISDIMDIVQEMRK